jgi:hypothetical protein
MTISQLRSHLTALIARRIAVIPTPRLLTVIIGSGSGSGSSGTYTYGHPTAHWSAIDVMVVHAAVMAAYVTSATAPSPSGRGFVRKGHDSCDADDNGDSQRDGALMFHDWPFFLRQPE